MNISNEVDAFLRQGFAITPVNGKKPFIDDWVNAEPEDIDEDKWKSGTGIGLICGKKSGLICLDIDRIQNGHPDEVYEKLLTMLPPILCGKTGNPGKPPARFFKYNGEKSRKFIRLGIEILSDGNQTVLPPSKHPEFDLYKWVGTPLTEIKIDDLPYLDTSVIKYLNDLDEHLKAVPSKTSKGIFKGSGRCHHGSHNQLSKMLVAMIHQDVPYPKIVERLLSYDETINRDADYFYFECPSRSEWKSKDRKVNCEAFVDQAHKKHGPGGSKYAKTDKEILEKKQAIIDQYRAAGKRVPRFDTYEFYRPFFRKHLPDVAINLIGGDPFFDDQRNPYNDLMILKSEALDDNLSDSKVEMHLGKFLYTETDTKLGIDIPEWDGEDRIKNIFDHLKFKNLTSDEACELFKEWGAKIFARIYNPDEQNRLLLLKGPQGKGKDTLIKNLLGGFRHLFSEITIHRNAVENYQVMAKTPVLNIAEFDQTAKLDVSFLKDMITKAGSIFRSPYGRAPERHVFRCSFIATTNADDILRDYTGNRRYQILDIASIDWRYPKEDKSQIVAQFYELYTDNFRASESAWKAMETYITKLTPDDPEDLILESYVSRYLAKKILPSGCRYPEIETMVCDIAKQHGATVRSIQRLLKRRGYSKKTTGGSIVYVHPSEISQDR